MRFIKELIADILDSICSETFEPYEYMLIDRGGIKYVIPITKE